MKQKYIKPTTNAFRLQLSHNNMLNTSVGVSSNDFDSNKGSIQSRRNSYWDDDEE